MVQAMAAMVLATYAAVLLATGNPAPIAQRLSVWVAPPAVSAALPRWLFGLAPFKLLVFVGGLALLTMLLCLGQAVVVVVGAHIFPPT